MQLIIFLQQTPDKMIRVNVRKELFLWIMFSLKLVAIILFDSWHLIIWIRQIQEMSDRWAPKKPNFGPPPPDYVPGRGRGAIGFITRSDLGPSRVPEATNINANEVDQANYPEGKFDSWQGERGALFSKGNLDEEDKQAEEAYDFCERRVWERGQKKRKQTEEKLKNQVQTDNSITSKFVDLKRQLAKVSTQEWETIPQCVDMSIKKRKKERFAPVPDSLLVNVMSSKEGMKTIEGQEENIEDFRQAKEVLLKSKLDNLENKRSDKATFDKIGYITQLNSKKIDAELLGDTKKARLLLKSALQSNPRNPDIWLSAARVEEIDGKIKQCRQLLRKGIEALPLCQDLWVELSRVQKPDQSKDVLIEGLRYLPSSQKLWLYAARREGETKETKSKILRKGLENIPTSVKLWRELIEIESMDQAKNLLYKAVESLPKEIDLWLALAKIEDYKNAQKVLNKARKCNPLSMPIWISAARLQQTQSKVQPVPKIEEKIESILTKGREVLKKNGANISREEWLQEAFFAEKSESWIVCQMLVKISVKYGLTEEQFNNVILKDVQLFEKEKESNQTTRFLYLYGVRETKNQELMREMIEFENRKRIRKEYHQLDRTLKFSLEMFGESKQFWKATIAKLIKEEQYESALNLIKTALPKIDDNDEEQIRLLRVKVLMIKQQYDQVRTELQELRKKFPKGESIFESIRFLYEIQNYKEAWMLCQKSFKESKSEKNWRLAFRIKEKEGSYTEAYSIIEKAVSIFPDSIPIWKDLIELQISQKHISKARALIDKANQKITKSEQFHLMAIQLQRKFSSKKEAVFAVSKALKCFPKSPQIWSKAIQLEPENTRKKKASSAIEACGQSVWINSAVGKLFWKENKLEKAKRWFQEGLKLSPNNGDVWALYIRLLQCHFENQKEEAIKKMMELQQNFEGTKWKRIEESRGGWRLQPFQILSILLKSVDQEIKSLD